MVFRNVIPDITVLGRSFVFSQSCLQVFACLPIHISSLTVSTLDSVHRFLFVARLSFGLLAFVTYSTNYQQRLTSER